MSKFINSIFSLNNITHEAAPAELHVLVQSFGNLDKSELLGQIEAATRIDYINPLLELLGWDVSNRQGKPLSKREVTYEPRQRIDGALKAPDYSLGIDGRRKLFVEAKRPSEHLETNRNHAYQLRRYSWSAGLPFGVLTDFQEFAIYDCSFAPHESDSADVARLVYFKFDELVENWPLVAKFLSREAVASGSLELLSEKTSFSSGEKRIDSSFLQTMRHWRKLIAQDIAKRNPTLTADRIDYETQTFLNKTIFLRILEDRGFEVQGALKSIADRGDESAHQLSQLFQRAHDKYNSGLFSGDGLSSRSLATQGVSLKLSDSVIVAFLNSLYFPNPFEFSVMPTDILGRIYELMLGEEVIFSDEGTRTTDVRLKPEVKKRGGVFYTPEPIVDYIVEDTVGPLIEGKALPLIQKIKVVDPAAGSGSFLVSVFRALINEVTDGLANKRNSPLLETGLDGQLRLKTSARKDLLTNCIFGVDIDAQAVEVCKLSLLLLVVENDPQLQFDFGHVLPSLDENILCGNSLIGPEFDDALVQQEFDSELNPFDWAASFPSIMSHGGFDAVVGNPPYLNIDAIWGKKDKRLSYLKAAYPHIYTDKTDLLFYFLEKSVQICKGEIGVIVSRSFLEADKAKNLRTWLARNTRVREILDFRDALVFPKVGINTLIFRGTKSIAVKSTVFKRWKAKDLPKGYDATTLRHPRHYDAVKIPVQELGGNIWNFGDNSEQNLILKMDAKGLRWSSFAEVGQGMQTGANGAFIFPNSLGSKFLSGSPALKNRISNSKINRYEIAPSTELIIYPEDFNSFEGLPIECREVLLGNRGALEKRAAFKRGNCEWWKYTWPLHKEYFGSRKVVSPYMASQTTFALEASSQNVYLTDTSVIYIKDENFPANALVALLNSEIANFRFEFLTKLVGGGQREYFAKQILSFPVPFMSGEDSQVQKLEELGSALAILHKTRSSTLQTREIESLTEEIAATSKEVEDCVANLYGLDEKDLEVIRRWKKKQ